MRPLGQGKDIPAGCQLTFALSLVFWLCVFELVRKWLGW